MHVSVDDPLFALILLAALGVLWLCMFLIDRAYRWAARTSTYVQAASVPDYVDDLLDLIALLLLGFGGILAEGIVIAAVQPDGSVTQTLHLFGVGITGGDAGWALTRLLLLGGILPFVFLRVGWDLGRLRRGYALWPLSSREREVNRALTLTFVALFCLTWLPVTVIFHFQTLTLFGAWVALALRVVWVPFARSFSEERRERPDYHPADEDESLSVFLAGFTGLLFLLGLAPWVTSDRLHLLFTCAALAFYLPHVIWLALHRDPDLSGYPKTPVEDEETPTNETPVEDEETLVPREAESLVENEGPPSPVIRIDVPMDEETGYIACLTYEETDRSIPPVEVSGEQEGEALTEEAGDETAPVEAPIARIPFHNPYHFWTELLDSAIVAVFLVFVVIRPFLLQAFFIPSPSMSPTLMEGDKLLATKVTYWIHTPHRGDICVFRAPDLAVSTSGMPQDPEHPLEYVKRVIGLPGDHLRIVAYDGVYINGVKLVEPYLHSRDQLVEYNFPREPDGSISREIANIPELRKNMEQYIVGEELVIPQGMLFMMGDNRNMSHDSHKWGPLPESAVLGQAFCLFWPPKRAGMLH